MTCLPETGVDIYLGTGGATGDASSRRARSSASSGGLQAKPWPRPDTDDAAQAKAKGID